MTTRRELEGHAWRKHLALPAPAPVRDPRPAAPIAMPNR